MSTREVEILTEQLSQVLGGTAVTELQRLSGGASRETWRFHAGVDDLILQRVRPGTVDGLKQEPAVLQAAARGGVPVAEMVFDGSLSGALERPFMIVRAVEGETIARKILRDDEYATARQKLSRQLGEALGHLHAIPVSEVPGLTVDDQLERFGAMLHGFSEPHPIFEIAIRWLDSHRPQEFPHRIVHGDFRMGNIIVGTDGLRAVLDWEGAHIGDPMEDLGWVCTKAWRFGGEQPVAGVGSYDDLLDGYEHVSGVRPDMDVLKWWVILGSLRWGIICMWQASFHLENISRSHELAAIGRRVCENEWDLIEMLEEEML
jgi:aminoglycoside phosphotransferase (APT) family kinase protein